MNLNQLIEMQSGFDKRHSGNEPFYVPISSANPRDLEHLVVCMSGELGEFANVTKKIIRGDFSFEEAEPMLREELTDLFIYLLKVAGQTGIDLEKSYLEKMEKNELRFAKWSKP
jgi:NTP pyrophosphatase (non-canonical NTP hydrolase)